MIITAIIIFIIGCLLLLFNKSSGRLDLLGFALIIAGFLVVLRYTAPCNIDLPEEYKEIKTNTPIVGKYDESTNTLYIWFNHK